MGSSCSKLSRGDATQVPTDHLQQAWEHGELVPSAPNSPMEAAPVRTAVIQETTLTLPIDEEEEEALPEPTTSSSSSAAFRPTFLAQKHNKLAKRPALSLLRPPTLYPRYVLPPPASYAPP